MTKKISNFWLIGRWFRTLVFLTLQVVGLHFLLGSQPLYLWVAAVGVVGLNLLIWKLRDSEKGLVGSGFSDDEMLMVDHEFSELDFQDRLSGL